jgi:hypothetical protein
MGEKKMKRGSMMSAAAAATKNYETAKSLFKFTTLAIAMQWENEKPHLLTALQSELTDS